MVDEQFHSNRFAQEKLDNDRTLLSSLRAYAEQHASFVDSCDNEDQTKLTLINPYIEVLGFNVRDPRVVKVEYTTAIGKGAERVDYAIFSDSSPVLFIEAKKANLKLDPSGPSLQIRRYAIDTISVKFVALTNGVEWHWYFKQEGRLSDKPFMVIDAFHPKAEDIQWLRHVQDGSFGLAATQAAWTASIVSGFQDWLKKIERDPSDDLLKLVSKEIKTNIRAIPIQERRALWGTAQSNLSQSRKQALIASVQNTEQLISTQSSQAEETLLLKEKEQPDPSPKRPSRRSGAIKFEDGSVETRLDGTGLMRRLIAHCAKQHKYGTDHFLSELRKKTWAGHAVLISSEERASSRIARYYTNRSVLGFHVFRNLTNVKKKTMVELILSVCKPIDRDHLILGSDILINLPNGVQQISDV